MDKMLNICLGILVVMLIGLVIIGVIAIGAIIRNNEDYGIVEGIIIEKDHNSAWTQYTYSGKIYVPIYHPESWKIKIKKEVEQIEKTRWVEVKEGTYNNLDIGDYYKESDRYV